MHPDLFLKGVDVHTHGEMLPANYYPAFKKYGHFVGDYGGSWWHQNKDFSAAIEMAKKCTPPKEIETGKTVGGLAHNQVLALADRVIDAVKSGAIKRFVAWTRASAMTAIPWR